MLRYFLLILLLFSPALLAQEQVNGGPSQVVERLNNALLEAMKKADELGYEGRYELLAPVIRSTYEFRSIAKYTTGEYWRTFTEAQQEKFVEKLIEYGIATYAYQFNGYDGETFQLISEEPFRQKFRIVKAVLEIPSEENVEFVYILRQDEGDWRIIDIRHDGVSDLALQKAQYTQILSKEGFDGLMAKLSEKISNYASKEPSSET